MSEEYRVNRKICQLLDGGTRTLDRRIEDRLHAARQGALLRHQQAIAAGELRLAGSGGLIVGIPRYARVLFAAIAFSVGIFATYATTTYLERLQQAEEAAEIDSALLADEIPFNAYLDQDFLEWLDHLAQDESSQG